VIIGELRSAGGIAWSLFATEYSVQFSETGGEVLSVESGVSLATEGGSAAPLFNPLSRPCFFDLAML